VDDLWQAIDAGDEKQVAEILDRRPELAGERNAAGLSPVLHALYGGHGDLADTILDANPPLDTFDSAATGRTRGLEELLDAEPALAQAFSNDGFTALHHAAYFGQEDAARILLERGAPGDVVSRNADIVVTPLHSAAAGAHPGIVKLLLEHGADPNARQPGGSTPLDAARQNGDEESAEALLAAGATPPPA
jgi:uncharacterized protein